MANTILDTLKDGTQVTQVTGTVTTTPGTGAATSANQTTGNTSLASIDGKVPALLATAPASDTGQSAIPVRIISQLGAGGGSSGLTDTQLRATPVPVSGTVTANAGTGTFAVSGPLTDTQIRATALPISGTVTANAGTGTFAVSGPLTDTQIRATALPVSGTVTANVGTTNGLALDATLTGGTAKSILRTAAKGSTVAGDATSTPVDANTQALDVSVKGTTTVSGTVTANAGTGTFAVSGPLTDTQIRATALPISGTVTANAGTGTFAVSGPLTDTQIRATALPVSGTVTANAGTNLNTSALALDTTLTGGTAKAVLRTAAKGTTVAADTTSTPVDANTQALDVSVKGTATISGTVTANAGTGTMATSLATLPALVAGSAIVGKVGVDQTTPGTTNAVAIAQIGSTTTATGNGVVGTGVQRVAIASDNTAFSVNAIQATLTKGTQGATGVTVQELKNAGRNQINFFMAAPVASTATDALMSLTGYKSGAAVAATTTPAVVTTGKTLRIMSITIAYNTIVTTPGSVRFTLRANTAGLVAIGSPVVCTYEVGEPSGAAPVAGKKNTIIIPLADGMEFAAGTGIGVSMVGLGAAGAAAIVGQGTITINGFEY